MQSNVPLIVGVDVSKSTLVCARYGSDGRESVANQADAIERWLRSLPHDALIAVESTGMYHQQLVSMAHAAGLTVFVLNARDVFFYAKALGTRGKSDRSDAAVIARYLAEHHCNLHPWMPGEAAHMRITELLRSRSGVTSHRAALRQLLRNVPSLPSLELAFDELLRQIDTEINELIASDQRLATAVGLLQSITGIGSQGAALLASLLSRIPFANADALVAYSGLDPRANDSGRKIGTRRLSKRGSPALRRQMYLAAFAASHSKALGPLYRCIKARGFKPTEALVILARKLLRVAWAVWKSGKPFDPSLLSPKVTCAQT